MPNRGGNNQRPHYEPTKAEIKAACEEIQAEWTPWDWASEAESGACLKSVARSCGWTSLRISESVIPRNHKPQQDAIVNSHRDVDRQERPVALREQPETDRKLSRQDQ